MVRVWCAWVAFAGAPRVVARTHREDRSRAHARSPCLAVRACVIFDWFSGKLADLTNRRLLLAGACVLWSGATAAMSLCRSFEQLLVTRVVAGVGQAFNAPCAYPLLLQLYGPGHRSTVNGAFAVGTYVGAALSSLSLGMAAEIGWRATSLFSGALGALAAVSLYQASGEARAAGISEGSLCGGGGPSRAAAGRRDAGLGGSYRGEADDVLSEGWEESMGLLDGPPASRASWGRSGSSSLNRGGLDGLDGEDVSDHEQEAPHAAPAAVLKPVLRAHHLDPPTLLANSVRARRV